MVPEFAAASPRARRVTERFLAAFGPRQGMELFSSPGRTELGGNHTDHQRGRVLAAAVSLDILACAAPNGEGRVRFISEGWPALELDLAEPGPIEAERGSPAALIRGVAGALRGPGRPLGGFDAYAASVLPAGAGLSSSAAFELLAAQIFNSFYCAGELDAPCLALAAQRAENEYFGKPCGLMDQLACALGGAAALDFACPSGPAVARLPFAPGRHGFALCLIHTGSGHADLTEEYAAVPREMRAVAAFFGREALRGLEEAELLAAAPELRRAVGDRALLRALHFIREDARAALQAEALLRGDFPAFLDLVRESARSSRELLQNIFPAGAVSEQPLALALSLAEAWLGGEGAARVHGGGFAGAAQAYVPLDALAGFARRMDAVFGPGSCRALEIRERGAGPLRQE